MGKTQKRIRKTAWKVTGGMIAAVAGVFVLLLRSVYKELHADRETGC